MANDYNSERRWRATRDFFTFLWIPLKQWNKKPYVGCLIIGTKTPRPKCIHFTSAKKEEKEQRSVVVVKVQQKLCTKYERHGLCIFAPHPCKILNNTTEMPSQWGWWWCFHKFTWSAPLVHRSFQARKVSHLNHGRWATHGSTLTIHALFSRVFLSTSCQGQMKTMFSRKRMMTLFSIVVAM